MISKAADVDSYLTEVTPERRPIIEKLRALCRRHLTGYVEGMEYGMPVYKQGDKMVAFASQKQYVALYGLGELMREEYRPKLVGANFGKGCIRFTKPDKIDFAVIEEMLTKKAQMTA